MSTKVTALVVVLIIGVVFCGFSWWLVRDDLARTEAELESISSYLDKSSGDLTVTQSELSNTQDNMSGLSAELEATRKDLNATVLELADTQAKLSAIETGAFHLHNPTLGEALDFLEDDRTDSHDYIDDEYVCSHFASEVNNNAEDDGIRCAFVDIRFPDSAHAIIAFETVDEGIVYFDPISDEWVRPAVGRNYWKCIEPKAGYKYEKPPFDDTILDIVIIW